MVASLVTVTLALARGSATAQLRGPRAEGESRTDVRGTVINARDAETEDKLHEARALLDAGNVDRGLEILQAANEATLGQGYVVERRGSNANGLGAPVFESATEAIRTLLRSYPDTVDDQVTPSRIRERYRAQFEGAASAVYERARAAADLEELTRCYRLYPLARVAFDSALLAGDLHLERGDLEGAELAWSTIDLSELTAADDPRAQWVAQRWLLLASVANRVQLHAHWSERLASIRGETPAAEPGSFPLPSPGAVDVAETSAKRPPLPFRRGVLEWRTFGAFDSGVRAAARGGQVPFVRQVGLGQSIFAVTLDRELKLFDLDTGKHVDEVAFPKVRSLLDPHQVEFFAEGDPCVRLQPVFGEGLIVSSYVARVNERRQYLGYIIEEPIPRRALLVCQDDGGRSTLWTSEQSEDPEISSLSFNSVPIIRDGRIYALGWRDAGFVESHLVCFDAVDGRVIWSTQLVANQVELTMFGQISSEPLMGGLLVEHGIVYALTNLGAVAAVRARDGEPLWITCYPSVKPEAATQAQGSRVRRYAWSSSQLVSFPDRLVMTPLNSIAALVVLKADGTLVASRTSLSGGRRTRYLVGRFGDHAVFTVGDTVRLAPGTDLELDGQPIYKLDAGEVEAMPALVEGGLVYCTDKGLYFQPLLGAPGVAGAELVSFRKDGRFDLSGAREAGMVTVAGEAILVANARQVACYREAPVDEQGPR
ncbi:MAG: PQQ-binding-like beta-propeller repeat protein [Planctomycetota bacterium]